MDNANASRIANPLITIPSFDEPIDFLSEETC